MANASAYRTQKRFESRLVHTSAYNAVGCGVSVQRNFLYISKAAAFCVLGTTVNESIKFPAVEVLDLPTILEIIVFF